MIYTVGTLRQSDDSHLVKISVGAAVGRVGAVVEAVDSLTRVAVEGQEILKREDGTNKTDRTQ